jgi:hypothetical protein
MHTDPTDEPPVPREAAAVILIRERAVSGEAEIFMLRRHSGASFMARSYVFPGGAADPGDRNLEASAGVELDTEALHYFAHWVTPSLEKKRFSARFFVAELPPGQTPSFDRLETVDQVWVTPDEALTRARELRLPPPQLRTMYDLREAAARGPSAVIELSRQRACHRHPIVPRVVEASGDPPRLALVLPWDPDYGTAIGEGIEMPGDHPLARGPSRFILDDHGWELVEVE